MKAAKKSIPTQKKLRKRNSKWNSFLHLSLFLLLIGFVGFVIYLSLPVNYYVHKAVLHGYPKIDNHSIFYNRVVSADDPEPWDFSENVDETTISPGFQKDFQKFGTVAFLVVHHKQVVLEEYWDNFSALSQTNSFSMAKSIVSLLVGCAISDGYIKSVNQPVKDFFPQWTSFEGKTLTIKDLLTMSAGVDFNEAHSTLFSKTTDAYYGNDLWRVTLSERLIEKPGVKFNYQSGVTQLLGFILQKATGKNISTYASEKIWTPIHAEEDALWSLDKKDGMEKAFCCFNTNARDFARIGQLILNKGFWNGKPVVDSSYIREATTPASWIQHTPKLRDGVTPSPISEPCKIYGYQFWIVNYEDMKLVCCRGLLGQYIIAIPELDLVIVRLGKKCSTEFDPKQDYPKDLEIWVNAALEVINR